MINLVGITRLIGNFIYFARDQVVLVLIALEGIGRRLMLFLQNLITHVLSPASVLLFVPVASYFSGVGMGIGW